MNTAWTNQVLLPGSYKTPLQWTYFLLRLCVANTKELKDTECPACTDVNYQHMWGTFMLVEFNVGMTRGRKLFGSGW